MHGYYIIQKINAIFQILTSAVRAAKVANKTAITVLDLMLVAVIVVIVSIEMD